MGYVSSDALIELQKTIELNCNIQALNLIVGMHYFDKFTKVQYNAASPFPKKTFRLLCGDISYGLIGISNDVFVFAYIAKEMNYLDKYLERIKQCGNIGLSAAIEKTVSNIIPQYISNFSFTKNF